MKMNIEAGKGQWGRSVERSSASTRSRAARHISRSLNTLELLKNRMLDELITTETSVDLVLRLRRAADESTSLAWATPYPIFLLPELLFEKSSEARRQFEHQEVIQLRSRGSISMAA